MSDIGLSDVLIYLSGRLSMMTVSVKMFALKPMPLPRCTAQSPQNVNKRHCPFLGVSILGDTPIRGGDRRGTELKLKRSLSLKCHARVVWGYGGI
jgi:hypothetical protein